MHRGITGELSMRSALLYSARVITLVIATRNLHKVGEIRAILGEDFNYVTLNEFPEAPEVLEDAETFAGNAAKKARELATWLHGLHRLSGQVFVLADDSGLEVDALNGAPGVRSARFAALDTGVPGNSSNAANNAKLLRLLADVPAERRAARFRCAIALATVPDSQPESSVVPEIQTRLFEGACEGRVVSELRGSMGFGYDPLFVPDGYSETFAQLGDDIKNGLSHRAKALAGLKRWFETGV
jgi:XTP/dITP diphosphohydrolase